MESNSEDDEFYDAYEMESEGEKIKVEEFTPREYQVEIINRALQENIIVFLPTGSGKTFIAVKVIEHFSPKLSDGMKTFFLVNTVALVSQQADHIRSCLPFKIEGYSGDMGVDYWDDEKWSDEINKTQIFVMTSQIFLDLLLAKRIAINRVNVLIFDECHQGVNKHPMRQVMMEVKAATAEKPRILGLTATLLNANQESSKKVLKALTELEDTFDATIMRATNKDMVLQFSTSPNERIIRYIEELPMNVPGNDLIVSTVNNLSNFLNLVVFPDETFALPFESPDMEAFRLEPKPVSKKLINYLSDIVHASTNLGTYGATKCILHKIIMFEKMKLVTKDFVFRVLSSMTTQLHLLRKQLLTLCNADPFVHTTDKLIKLLDLLKNFPPDYCAIIFVERRSTAQVLAFLLKDIIASNPEFQAIRPDFVVGYNASGKESVSREGQLSRKINNAILKRFRKKEVNVLFASSVIEEGIDIRACNMVIKFDTPLTFRSYIQSKGRARRKDSLFVIFANPTFDKLYAQFRETEELLNSKLIQRITPDPCDDDDENHYYQINGPDGPKISSLSAISLINRYCAMLPQDKYSKLTVQWWLKKGKSVTPADRTVAFLKFPVNCPVKNFVEGPPRQNKKSAMRLAALEACKLLHLHGELNSLLQPCGKDDENLLMPSLFPNWCNEKISGKPGSKKMKRSYKQHCPIWLKSCSPVPKAVSYIHIVVIKPVFSCQATIRLQAFYDLLESSRTFGIITSGPLPKICGFPLYMNVGEVSVRILENECQMNFSDEEINLLRSFHSLLFTEVLPLVQNFMIQADQESEDSYLVAPIIYDNGSVEVDWNVIQAENKFPEIIPLPFEQRLKHSVTPELYLHNLVVPWYRSKDEILRYVVTRIRNDLNPESEFPESNFLSYTAYFQEKYNQLVFDLNQPLIEVRAISSKINCLRPRSKRRGKKDENFEETLVPELCYLIKFPAVYALKFSSMPSVLYRLTHLLSCEELRQEIARETGLGCIELDKKSSWKPLILDSMNVANEEEETKDPDQIINFRAQTYQNKDVELIDITRELEIDIASIIHYHHHMMQMSPARIKSPSTLTPDPYCNPAEIVPVLAVLNKKITNTHGPELRELFTALTSASAADIVNYERLETLGDSFLKFAASLVLYIQFDTKDEGKLTSIKGRAISNSNLFYCGREKLGPRLKIDEFSPSEWKVPGYTVPHFILPLLQSGEIGTSVLVDINISPEERVCGKLEDSTTTKILKLIENFMSENKIDFSKSNSNRDGFINKLVISDKVIADAVEALLCVYLEEFGINGGLKMVEWLGILPPDMCQASVLLKPIEISPEAAEANQHLVQPDTLETIIGYQFKDRSILLQALTHPSAVHGLTDCYQRLEFLGDAIIDFLITSYIYENCGDLSPGKLTDLRSALVNNNTFACLTVRYGLHKHIVAMGFALDDAIHKFVMFQEENDHQIDSNVLCLINENDIKVAGTIDVPKVLGDVFESIIGAVFLDCGKDFNLVWKVLYNLMGKEIKKFSKNIPINSIRKLYETFPAVKSNFGSSECVDGKYIIPLEIITDQQYVFYGMGMNKYEAKLAAAKLALQSLCDE